MDDIENIIKSRVEDMEKKIKQTKKLIKVAKSAGVDVVEHEITLKDIEDKINKIKKDLEE